MRRFILAALGLWLTGAIWRADLSAAEEAPAWKAHPPEYYAAIRTEVVQRIRSQLERADLRAMGWYAEVRESADSIEIQRETWTLVFDRRTAGVARGVVRGWHLDKGLVLADVVATDGAGKKFFRSLATDGTLELKQDRLHVYLDGAFTPKTRDGQVFPVRFGINYDIYKSCGLIVVRIKALKGSAHVLELRAVHTLGQTPKPLRFFEHSSDWLGNEGFVIGAVADSELVDYKDGVYYEAKFGSALWSDGAIGLEAIPLPETYLRPPPPVRADSGIFPIGGGWQPANQQPDLTDPRYSPDRLMVVAVENNASRLDFVLMRRERPAELTAGYENGWTFSLLPFRRLRPRPIMHSGALHSLSWHFNKWAPAEEVEAAIRRIAADGADLVNSYMTHNAGGVDGMFMPDNATTRWLRQASQIAKRYGLICQGTFILWTSFSKSQMLREQLLTGDELDALRRLSGVPPEVDPFQCDTNAPEYRNCILASAAIAAKEAGAHGVYFDLAYSFGPLPGLPSNIEGNVRLLEELRLLLDSYGPGGAITWHSNAQVTPAESLADFPLPGEPRVGSGQYFLTPGQNAIAYNSLLVGSNVVPHALGNVYQTDKPEVWKQFLANGVCSACIGDKTYGNPPTEANIVRYLYPLKIFGVEHSEVHSWQDGDFSDYVTVDNAACMVNAYVRKGEMLLTASLPPLQRGKARLTLHASAVQLSAPRVIIFDPLHGKARLASVENGMLSIDRLQLTEEPAILYIRELESPDEPLVLWRDHNLEDIELQPVTGKAIALNQGKYDVKCRFKVARAEGEKARFYLYRGRWGAVFATYWTPFRQIADDPESRVSVIEVTSPPVDPLGEISWNAAASIWFDNSLPGWRQ